MMIITEVWNVKGSGVTSNIIQTRLCLTVPKVWRSLPEEYFRHRLLRLSTPFLVGKQECHASCGIVSENPCVHLS
jgi:hypothetical protein